MRVMLTGILICVFIGVGVMSLNTSANESKKIVLSAIAALKEKSDEDIENYIKNFKLERVNVENIRSAETGTIDSSEFPIFEVPEPDANAQKKEENK